MTSEEKPDQQGYEAPQVEEMPADDGPAVTAAGKSPPQDLGDSGPEWQADERPDDADR